MQDQSSNIKCTHTRAVNLRMRIEPPPRAWRPAAQLHTLYCVQEWLLLILALRNASELFSQLREDKA